jgi:hypothetical protein
MASVDHQVAISNISPNAAQASGLIVAGAGTIRVIRRNRTPSKKPITWLLGNPLGLLSEECVAVM